MSIKRGLYGRAGGVLAVALLLLPLLAACGGGEPTATPPPPAEPTATQPAAVEPTATEAMAAESPTAGGVAGGTLKVGLVTDVGRLNDKSFNQSSWEGVEQAKKELGVEAKSIETQDTKDYAKNIGQFIDEKYDVIVTVGFALGEATIKAATENPTVKFIGVDQFQDPSKPTLPNLAGLIFDEDKSGYLAGVLAASISKTGNIGSVCGTDIIPPVWRFGEGYKAGAISVKPDIKLQVTYHSDVDLTKTFDDPEWGKTTALSMIDKGADVVFGAGGKTGNGAIYAAKEKNIAAIGVDTDQYLTIGDEYKSALVSSAMKLLTPGVFNLIKTATDGTFKGGNNTGPVGLAPFHDWEDKVPADVKQKLQDVDKALKDGTIKTCVSPAKGVPSPCGGAEGTPAETPMESGTTPTP